MLKITLIGIFTACLTSASAQSGVQLNRFPLPLQLYQRGPTNLAPVVVTGTATPPYTHVALKVLRAMVPYYFQKNALNGADQVQSFVFAPTIRAEAIEYRFQLYAYTSADDSILVKQSDRIVCGDVLILYGQSNMIAQNDIDGYIVDDRLLRNFSYPYQSTNIPNEVAWSTAKQPYGSVGGIGLWLQKLILEHYGIPTCAINGSVGGTLIQDLNNRTSSNHADLNTPYGLLLYRLQRAELAQRARIAVFKQGEANACCQPIGYADELQKLVDHLKEDCPALEKIYVSQLNILANVIDRAGEVREAQRRAKERSPLIENIATVGTPAYDGVHYLRTGNQQIAYELFRQIARDFYGAADTLQINSPNIRRAVYNARRDTVTLTFDQEMHMVWPADSTLTNSQGNSYTRRLIDFIYLDGESGRIANGFARGNQIVLALRSTSSAQTITYLPTYFSDANNAFYDGVHLKNERGLRAFTFQNFSITAAADAIYSVRSGFWTNPATWWLSQVPMTIDQVQIRSGHTVSLPAGHYSVRQLSLQGGALQLLPNAKLEFSP